MGWTVDETRAFAHSAHKGQCDQLGHPFAQHLEEVRQRVSDMGGEEEDQIAALLHHVIADGNVSSARLRMLGLPERAITIVEALTERPGESDEARVQRAMETPGAVRVLRADVEHHLLPDQLRGLNPDLQEQAIRRYTRMLAKLDFGPELTLR